MLQAVCLQQQMACCQSRRLHQGATLRHVLNAGRPLPQRLLSRSTLLVPNATESTRTPEPDPLDDDFEVVLLPEDDWVVPGTLEDAYKAGTKLGKAVNSACEELASLGDLENQVLNDAQQLLQKVGFKGNLFQPSSPPQQQQQQGAAEPPADADPSP